MVERQHSFCERIHPFCWARAAESAFSTRPIHTPPAQTIREGSQPTTLVDMLETIKDLANNSAYGERHFPMASGGRLDGKPSRAAGPATH